MNGPDATRPSLLARIRDPNDGQAWTEFVQVYSPFVYKYVRRRGLQPSDASDVAQEVMRSVFCALDGFEHRERPGSFRKWLVTIVRSRVSDFVARRRREVTGSGDTKLLEQLNKYAAPETEEAEIEHEYQQCVFRWAADQVSAEFRPTTWQAFWRTYVQGEDCQQVAVGLDVSVEAVYMARSRVLARLQKKVQEVEE